MGLDTTHDCWHGAYSAFYRFRETLARAAGIPYGLMRGVYGSVATPQTTQAALAEWLPLEWASLKPDPVLYAFLTHSDCDGSIPWKECGPLADRLEELLPHPALQIDEGGHLGIVVDATETFIKGLRLAASLEEDVEFH